MEKEIKKLLGIREAASIKAIKKNIKRRGNKEFLYLIVVTRDMEGREKQYHVPSYLTETIQKLWIEEKKKRQKAKKLVKELMGLIESSFEEEKMKQLIFEHISNRTYNHIVRTYLSKAKELFREYIEELQRLGREGVLERLTILQVLYLLANLKEISEAQENPKLFFKKGINTIIRVARNERIPNPFGTLKNDFFLSGRQTPYDFLLSNFLEEIIGETLRELLEKEIEKKKAKEEVREYKEKMEKLKEIAQWFESLPLEIKLLAKEIISGNVVEIAEKVLKDMKESGYELSKISAFLENSSRESLIEYFKYLKSL